MIDLKSLKFAELLGDNDPDEVITDPETVVDPPVVTEEKKKIPVDPILAEKVDEDKDSKETGDSEDVDEPTVIFNLATSLGYTFEEGEKYEDNEAGLIAFTTKAAEKKAGEQLLEFFGQMPDVEEYARFRINGGDPSKYFEAIGSQTPVELTEENAETQRFVMTKFLTKQGYETAEISEMITDYEDTGLLFKNAKMAQNKLVKLDASDKQRVIEAQQKIKDKEIAENRELWNNIETTVTEGVIKGIKIPDTEKKKFFEWMSKPIDKQGRSQRDVAREKLDTETMVALEYLQFKNFDLGNLVKAKANTLQAKELRERLAGGGVSKKLSGTGTQPARKPDQLPAFKDILG